MNPTHVDLFSQISPNFKCLYISLPPTLRTPFHNLWGKEEKGKGGDYRGDRGYGDMGSGKAKRFSKYNQSYKAIKPNQSYKAIKLIKTTELYRKTPRPALCGVFDCAALGAGKDHRNTTLYMRGKGKERKGGTIGGDMSDRVWRKHWTFLESSYLLAFKQIERPLPKLPELYACRTRLVAAAPKSPNCPPNPFNP